MSVEVGSEITVDIEKPVAGGRMLARHDGQVVLVWGAIPGERVRVQVDRLGRGLLFANTVEVLRASADRRDADPDWRCGGNVYAHVVYPRQTLLKGEIIHETLARIGHVHLPSPPDVKPSPEHGYRMRARFRASGGRLGFFREGTHQLCDPVVTRQLSEDTHKWIADVERVLQQEQPEGVAEIEISENIAGDERACHLELHAGVDRARFKKLADVLGAVRSVSDVLHVRERDPASALRLRRTVRAFFQANRFLLEPLARFVTSLVPPGPVVDLYAGVGLFGLSLAAIGVGDITLVEGDPVSGADLQDNAEPFRSAVRVERSSVESYVGRVPRSGPVNPTFIVDPPRTGMTKQALAGIIASRPARIIYVSCDVATLARDTRTILDAGYELEGVTGMDMFPNTAHVEGVVVFR
jgi:23S rRNA (uracil1939-C5)-methyltransferase